MPRTVHYQYVQERENVTYWKTDNLGKAFNLVGGQSLDDTLEYRLRGQDLYVYIQHFAHVIYYVEYRDNFGKKMKIRIVRIVNESDMQK